MMGCALRGGHAYQASRKLDGYDTCAHCGHRRRAIDTAWLAEPLATETIAGHGRAGDGSAGQDVMVVRPLAALGCAIRRFHNYVPSRRMEGYDTCLQCGKRRKSLDGTWFAAPAPKPAAAVDGPSQAAVEAGPISTPAFPSEPVIGPVGDAGVDPRILRDFLRQIDSGAFRPEPRSGGSRRSGRAKSPKP